MPTHNGKWMHADAQREMGGMPTPNVGMDE